MGPSLGLTLLRWLHDAMLLSLFGVLAFPLAVLPFDLRGAMEPALRRAAWVSGIGALLAGMGWLLAETAFVAGTGAIGSTFQAVPAFIEYLRFGQVLLGRLVLVAGAAALCRRPGLATGLSGAALALQPWLGHPGEVGSGLTISEVLHLLTAGIWLGGLIPLLLSLAILPGPQAARVFKRFTGVGLIAVATLGGTGLAQGFALAGGAAGLVSTTYGHVALLKAGLFAVALVLAARNGLVLTSRLASDRSIRPFLARSVAAEALIGGGILFAAALLAGLPPRR